MNDTYGHDFGDEVLKGVSSLLIRNETKNIRCYRYGGEEMVIMLEHFDIDHAVRFCEHIRTEISLLKWRNNVHVTASLGLGFETLNCKKKKRIKTCTSQSKKTKTLLPIKGTENNFLQNDA